MYIDQGSQPVDTSPMEYAQRVRDLGAGEIFLNSIDRDGMADGYDIDIIKNISQAVNIPVIACGGAGFFDDFVDVFKKTGASAAAAGNIFNFTENAYRNAKKELIEAGCQVRPFIGKQVLEEKLK